MPADALPGPGLPGYLPPAVIATAPFHALAQAFPPSPSPSASLESNTAEFRPSPALQSLPAAWGDQLEALIMRDFGDGSETYQVPLADELKALHSLVAQVACLPLPSSPAVASPPAPGPAPVPARNTGERKDEVQARQAAAALGYELQVVMAGARRVWMLSEHLPELGAKSPGRGWGTLLVDPAARSEVILEVPHPGFDLRTPQLGWACFTRLGARALLVAGAVRGNHKTPLAESATLPGGGNSPQRAQGVPAYSVSDPTHAPQSAFETMHEALLGPHSQVLQLHGFSAAKHHAANPGFAPNLQAVLSDGADDGYDPPGLLALAQGLRAGGYACQVATFEGPSGRALGATANVQGQAMRRLGFTGRGKLAEFIHLELESAVRRGPEREAHFQRLMGILAEVFGGP